MNCDVTYQISIPQGVNVKLVPRECGREAIQDGKCICHLDDPNKPIEPILVELEKMYAAGVWFDCSYFVFPTLLELKNPINKPAFFEHAKFYGDVSFKGLIWGSYTSFHSAEFHGKADFGYDRNMYEKQTQFRDHVNFNSTMFLDDAGFCACIFKAPPEFNGTEFHKGANFALSELAYKWPEPLEFRLVEFRGDANLGFKIRGEIPAMKFAYCNLEGLLFYTLPRDDIAIEFDNIKQWGKRKKWYQGRPLEIRDESTGGMDSVRLVDTYRFLEKYHYNHSGYSLASQFYLGQMVALRRDKEYKRPSRILNHLYQLVSNYGESLIRPIIALFITWLIFPVILLFTGMNVNTSTARGPVVKQVNYELSWFFDTDKFAEFWSDYNSALGANLALSTIDRKNELSPLPDSLTRILIVGETVLNVVLASLIVVAARRKFTPKKPTGE